MLQLFRFLIFGKQCFHQWELEVAMEPWNNDKRYLYICKKCGKFKKVRLRIVNIDL